MMSKPFTINKTDLVPVLKVLGWSVGSAVVTALISLLAVAQMPPNWVWVVPLVNTLLYTVQRWIAENR